MPTESKGISLISSSAKGISPRSRLLQDFCTKVWGEERCKILCPAADRKKCFRIQKTSPKQIRRKKYPKRDPKSIYSWNQNMISSRNCAGDSVMCNFCPIKRDPKKNIQVPFSAGFRKSQNFPPRRPSSMMRGSEGSTWRFKKTTAIFCSLTDIFKKSIGFLQKMYTFVDLVGSGSLLLSFCLFFLVATHSLGPSLAFLHVSHERDVPSHTCAIIIPTKRVLVNTYMCVSGCIYYMQSYIYII